MLQSDWKDKIHTRVFSSRQNPKHKPWFLSFCHPHCSYHYTFKTDPEPILLSLSANSLPWSKRSISSAWTAGFPNWSPCFPWWFSFNLIMLLPCLKYQNCFCDGWIKIQTILSAYKDLYNLGPDYFLDLLLYQSCLPSLKASLCTWMSLFLHLSTWKVIFSIRPSLTTQTLSGTSPCYIFQYNINIILFICLFLLFMGGDGTPRHGDQTASGSMQMLIRYA